jgi:hypothetical protein
MTNLLSAPFQGSAPLQLRDITKPRAKGQRPKAKGQELFAPDTRFPAIQLFDFLGVATIFGNRRSRSGLLRPGACNPGT